MQGLIEFGQGVQDRLKRHRIILLVGGMYLDKVPLATIRFMIDVYDVFLSGKAVSCKDLANAYKCTAQSAQIHVRRLTEKNYLTRKHYRAWEINNDYLLSLNPT